MTPALLSLIGSSSYRLLRDICHPDLPSTKDYNTLCIALKDHFSPKPIVIAERFRFYKRDQQVGESVKDFNVALRKLSEYCDFGANLKDSLRDRFVCGLRNEAIQKKLLSVDKLTYEKALEIALAMESASKDVLELQNKQIPVQKIKIKKHKKKTEKHYPKTEKQPQNLAFTVLEPVINHLNVKSNPLHVINVRKRDISLLHVSLNSKEVRFIV